MAAMQIVSIVIINLFLLFDLVVVVQGQTGNILEYNVFEEEPGNKRVGDVKLDSNIASRRTSEELNELEFVFRYSTGMYQLFTLNKRTGVVRTNASIDREAICAYQTICDIDLDIKVNPVTYFEIIKIKVKIEDKNDNKPKFPQSQRSTSVAETTMPGALIPIPSADDKDSGIYGIQEYRLETDRHGREKFDLQTTQHSDGSMDIKIVLLQKLDREKESFYTLVVYALDGDEPQQTGSITVDLTVTDVNDNSPTFDNNTYETTIYENLPLRSTIVQVHASDPDSGDFGEVVYSFGPSTQSEYLDLFGIDSKTGEIYVKGLIDYEVHTSFQFNVQAKDKGANSLGTFTKIKIRVLDLNDHAPMININALTDSGDAEVLENADVGTFVAHVAVMDPDLGPSGLFECEIDNDLFQLVLLSGSTMEYTLVSRTVFDREKIAQYPVLLSCEDKGSPVLTAVEQILVKVTDVNDHAPVFPQDSFTATLRENNSLSAFVFQIEADDEDTGKNAVINYSLQGKDPSETKLLIIDARSGVVKANAIFDYEKKNSYDFVVTATDNGEPSQSTTVDLRLEIQDVNDEYPVFNEETYLFNVQEGLAKGTSVGKVTATDNDSPLHGNITYRIDPGPRGSHRFYIDRTTGQIFTAELLDWEEQEVYYLEIVAQNVGSPSVQTEVNCRVLVQDINDNAPIIDFPSRKNNTLEISSQNPVDHKIAEIRAHDPDSEENGNGRIRFHISEENNIHFFKINSKTGWLTVARAMEDVEYQQVKISVTVTDQGQPPKASHERLTVIIDKSLPSSQTQNNPSLTTNLMAILGSLAGLIFIIVVVTIAVCFLKYRRRRLDSKGAKYNCRLEANKALNGNGGVKITGGDRSSYDDDTASVKSDCSMDSPMKEAIKPLKKEVTFTFSHDEPYIQRSPAGRPITQETSLSQDTPKFLSPAKKPCRPVELSPSGRANKQYPHITDPRKYSHPGIGLRHYDRSPTHPGAQHTGQSLQAGAGGAGMHDLLNLSNHTDLDSECSGTDSGRGPSEEGDNLYANHGHPHSHYTPLSSSSHPPHHNNTRLHMTGTPPKHPYTTQPSTQSYRVDPHYSNSTTNGEYTNVNSGPSASPLYSTPRTASQRHSMRERSQERCSPERSTPERSSMRVLPAHQTAPALPDRPHYKMDEPSRRRDEVSLTQSPERRESMNRYHQNQQNQPQELDARELIPLQKLKLTDRLSQQSVGRTQNANGEESSSANSKTPMPNFSTFKTSTNLSGAGSDRVPNIHQSHTDCVHPRVNATNSDHNGNYGGHTSQTGGNHNSGYNQQQPGGSQNSSFDHSSLNAGDVSTTSDYSSRPSSATSNRDMSLYQKLPDPISSANQFGNNSPHKQLPSLLKTQTSTAEPRDQQNGGYNKKEVRFAEDYDRSRPQDVCSSLEGVSDSETCTSGSYVLDPAGMLTIGRVNNGAQYEDLPSFSVV